MEDFRSIPSEEKDNAALQQIDPDPVAAFHDLFDRVTALEQRLAKLQAGVSHIVSIPGIPR